MAWDVVYYKSASGDTPVEPFLDHCPGKVEAKIQAVLTAVAAAPPPQFSGGGMWEAMHGDMTGYFDVSGGGPTNAPRKDGAGGRTYKGTVAQKAAAMGIDWMTGGELVESIPPDFTEAIGRKFLIWKGVRPRAAA